MGAEAGGGGELHAAALCGGDRPLPARATLGGLQRAAGRRR